MVRLDRSRPFGELLGVAGGGLVEQDGIIFRADGTPHDPALRDIPDDIPKSVKDEDDYTRLSSLELRAALEVYGETYTTRTAALNFLRGKK